MEQPTHPSLAEFLLARIGEDEVVARAATPGVWRAVSGEYAERIWSDAGEQVIGTEGGEPGGVWASEDAAHIARYDPARVLAECAAKRQIVELHDHDDSECFEIHRGVVAPDWPEGTGRVPGEPWSHSSLEAQEGPCPTLRALASVYADHPDYRQEWKP